MCFDLCFCFYDAEYWLLAAYLVIDFFDFWVELDRYFRVLDDRRSCVCLSGFVVLRGGFACVSLMCFVKC